MADPSKNEENTAGSNPPIRNVENTDGSNSPIRNEENTDGSNSPIRNVENIDGSNSPIRNVENTDGSNSPIRNVENTDGSNSPSRNQSNSPTRSPENTDGSNSPTISRGNIDGSISPIRKPENTDGSNSPTRSQGNTDGRNSPIRNREGRDGSNSPIRSRASTDGSNSPSRAGWNKERNNAQEEGRRPSAWLLGDLPTTTYGFQGGGRRTSSSVHDRHTPSPLRRPSRGQAHGRVSQWSPPELMIRSARTTASPASSPTTSSRPGGQGLGIRSELAAYASPSSLQVGTRLRGVPEQAEQPYSPPGFENLVTTTLQQARGTPSWSGRVPPYDHEQAPLDVEALLTDTQVREFRKAVNFAQRPLEVQQIVKTEIVSGRAGLEATEALARSLQEAVSKRDLYSKEEILRAKVQAVNQFANPYIPNCDPDESDVRVPRLPSASGVHRPRFNRAWVEALTNPARAADEAARWMFAERVVVTQGNLQLEGFNTRLEHAARESRRERVGLKGRERTSRLQRLQDADRDFVPKLMIPTTGRVLTAQTRAADEGTTSTSVMQTIATVALVYAECVGRIKVANTGSLLKDPASIGVLPLEALAQIDAFLRLRGLPTMDVPGLYDAFLSPGVFLGGGRPVVGSEWAKATNATLVLQRRKESKGTSSTALELELELRRIKERVQKWIPLFRAYLGEYADLLGAMMMETPPHIDHAPVCATVDRDFWPSGRKMPDAALMQELWGDCEENYGFHMNMALLTSFVTHGSKMEVAMDELDVRWTDLLDEKAKGEEAEYRRMIKEIEPLTHQVESLLCSVAAREQADSCALEEDWKIVQLIQQKEAAENKMAVVDPLIYSIWSRHLLEMFRTLIAKGLSEMAIIGSWDEGMPELTHNFYNIVERWHDWYLWIRRTPKAMDYLATLGINAEVLAMTVTTNRDEHRSRATLQFLANKAAHRVVHPWVAEAISSPQLSYMADTLQRWFYYVYNNYGFTVENSRLHFVPDFDIKSDPLDHYWEGEQA